MSEQINASTPGGQGYSNEDTITLTVKISLKQNVFYTALKRDFLDKRYER